MAATTGWYPDPSDPTQLRFWDGSNWTSATGPMPRPRQSAQSVPDHVMAPAGAAMPPGQASGFATASWPGAPAQPAEVQALPGSTNPYFAPGAGGGAGYPGQAGPLPQWTPAPQRGRLGTKARTAIAAGITIAVAAGVTVPLLLNSGKSAMTKAFERSLLTPGAVSSVANETFTIDTSKNSSNDGPSSGCLDTIGGPSGSGKDRGDAERNFVSADHTTFVMEDLNNNSSNAQVFDQVKKSISTCTSSTIDGASMTIQSLSPPQVAGSDDAMSLAMTGQINGTTISFDFAFVRFGDNVVMVMTGGVDISTDLPALTNSLMTEAVNTARPALPKA